MSDVCGDGMSDRRQTLEGTLAWAVFKFVVEISFYPRANVVTT